MRDDESIEGSGSKRNEMMLLVAVLIMAATLRLVGIGFGLPFDDTRPDEREYVVETAIAIYESGSLHPREFDYPSLFPYLMLVIYLVVGGISVVFGNPETRSCTFALHGDRICLYAKQTRA